MDLIVWALIGCAVGWASYAFLRFNEKRGVHVAVADDFSRTSLLFAATVAATVLALGNLVYARWGV